MPFALERIVPWGRSFDEYRRMFALTEEDLERTILGCADGPASFNAEGNQRGSPIVSVDPIYAFSRAEIQQRIDATFDEIMEQTRRNKSDFLWTTFRSVDELGRARMTSMRRFLDDFEAGLRSGRYIAAELPRLPFGDQSFELALCSHFLFLYTDQLSEAFHVESALELCRAADEVRIFPLVSLDGGESRHVEPVAAAVKQYGRSVKIEPVPYEFQKGANQMMRIV
jgi:hypothetical protein